MGDFLYEFLFRIVVLSLNEERNILLKKPLLNSVDMKTSVATSSINCFDIKHYFGTIYNLDFLIFISKDNVF